MDDEFANDPEFEALCRRKEKPTKTGLGVPKQRRALTREEMFAALKRFTAMEDK